MIDGVNQTLNSVSHSYLTNMSKILAEENADLQNQLDETRQQLHFALEDLNDEKKGHNFALEKLKADKEKIEEDLTDTIATTMMLEKQIEELKIIFASQ